MRVMRIVAKAAVAFYDELFFYAGVGLLNLISWLVVIPGPFALVGLYAVGHNAIRGRGIKWPTVWEGVKEFGLRSFVLWLTIGAVYVVIGFNLWFYLTPDASPIPTVVAAWATPLFLFIGLIWTGVTFYAQAFMMELESPRIRLILRNSLFLTILQPIQTLMLLMVAALTLAVSIALPVLLIVWPGFVSTLALTAVRTMVEDLSNRAKDKQDNDKSGKRRKRGKPESLADG